MKLRWTREISIAVDVKRPDPQGREEPVHASLPTGPSSYRELVREMDDLAGCEVSITMTDVASAFVPVCLRGKLGEGEANEAGWLYGLEGQHPESEVFLEEEVYVEGEAWTNGIRGQFGSVEIEVEKIVPIELPAITGNG